ncbi:uncharacterized protein LOC117200824 [Orcinus orca]|uniref:uncharacterized protein LOC117200824 n=1 Tax=Orcinus orca TaxID=9733 RepID=UPI0021138B36|nr:uncharacterized protein LOC117200824 [Orcinus orca]
MWWLRGPGRRPGGCRGRPDTPRVIAALGISASSGGLDREERPPALFFFPLEHVPRSPRRKWSLLLGRTLSLPNFPCVRGKVSLRAEVQAETSGLGAGGVDCLPPWCRDHLGASQVGFRLSPSRRAWHQNMEKELPSHCKGRTPGSPHWGHRDSDLRKHPSFPEPDECTLVSDTSQARFWDVCSDSLNDPGFLGQYLTSPVLQPLISDKAM